MTHPVVHFEIGSRDAARQAAFYGAVFGWTFDTSDPASPMLADTEGSLGGGIMQLPDDVPPYLTVYVRVDDLVETLHRVEDLGGSCLVPPRRIAGVGEFALFTDPEGHVVGLFARTAGPS